jgi:hypothetical protein
MTGSFCQDFFFLPLVSDVIPSVLERARWPEFATKPVCREAAAMVARRWVREHIKVHAPDRLAPNELPPSAR